MTSSADTSEKPSGGIRSKPCGKLSKPWRWTARGDQTLLDTGARQFAEAVGTLMGVLVEAVVFLAAARGIGTAVAALRGTRFGRALGEARLREWLSERVQTTHEGRGPIPTPRSLWRGRRGAEQGEGEAGKGEIGEAGKGETGNARGYYEDGTAAYDGNIQPNRLTMITKEAEWKLGHEEAKIDIGNGNRIYQRRIHVKTPEGEKIVINIE